MWDQVAVFVVEWLALQIDTEFSDVAHIFNNCHMLQVVLNFRLASFGISLISLLSSALVIRPRYRLNQFFENCAINLCFCSCDSHARHFQLPPFARWLHRHLLCPFRIRRIPFSACGWWWRYDRYRCRHSRLHRRCDVPRSVMIFNMSLLVALCLLFVVRFGFNCNGHWRSVLRLWYVRICNNRIAGKNSDDWFVQILLIWTLACLILSLLAGYRCHVLFSATSQTYPQSSFGCRHIF